MQEIGNLNSSVPAICIFFHIKENKILETEDLFEEMFDNQKGQFCNFIPFKKNCDMKSNQVLTKYPNFSESPSGLNLNPS